GRHYFYPRFSRRLKHSPEQPRSPKQLPTTDQTTGIMDGCPVPHDLDIHNIDGIGNGSFAQVSLVRNSRFIVKITSDDTYEHLDRERLVYERLENHPNTLQFYGEVRVNSSERTLRGLLLEYHLTGTLDKMLSAYDLEEPKI
ncbi:hypothetical protein TOPH_00686, partial [Tolypocladium ophioglossoides CBS 100239]